ncbi:hypothetical protein P3S67_009202 [Capsicum chacoense]
MDEKGVHFPLNAQKFTVPDVGTASPVQMVTDKDKSNPLMVVTLPKSEDEDCSSSRHRIIKSDNKTSKKTLISRKKSETIETIIKQTLDRFFSQQTQDKHVDEQPSTNTDRLVPEINDEDINEDNEFTHFQDAQDPYKDDDSGMSFDSIALHNLDT